MQYRIFRPFIAFALAGACALPAAAASVSGAARITGTHLAGDPVDIPLTDGTDPVAISRTETVTGAATGTILGSVRVNGSADGEFDLFAFGQRASANEASFQYEGTYTNQTGEARSFVMNFVIASGQLRARIFEPAFLPDDRYRAGYAIDIRIDGQSAFSSGADLRHGGALSVTGTDLGGVLSHDPGAPESWSYDWLGYAGVLDLGVLAPDQTVTIGYDASVYALFAGESCGANCGSVTARIGDPFAVDGANLIGAPDQFIPAVPLPAAAVLLAPAIALLGTLRRRA
ncbi:MAG: hypothetical protein AB7Q97_01125 [Gammaproteobacteria bacterium]